MRSNPTCDSPTLNRTLSESVMSSVGKSKEATSSPKSYRTNFSYGVTKERDSCPLLDGSAQLQSITDCHTLDGSPDMSHRYDYSATCAEQSLSGQMTKRAID
jgi:hypothetical protein